MITSDTLCYRRERVSANEGIVGLGTRADHVAVVPNVDLSRAKLSTEERAVLVAVGRVSTIAEVLARVGLAEPRAIAAMLALRAKGVIAPAKVHKPAPPAPVTAAASEQVDLDEDRKKELLELERTLEEKNHFQILGLSATASSADVKRAYHDASLKFHPDRFFNKNLGSFRARIERIFRRITEANSVLSDEGRRAAYLRSHPELAAEAPRSTGSGELPAAAELDPERAAERRARMARHPYLAKARQANDLMAEARELMAKGEFSRAMTVLNTVVQIDPRHREAQPLLQEARKKNDVQRAAQELQKAREAELAGDLGRALAAYRVALELDPASATAHARAAVISAQLGEELGAAVKLAQKAAELEPRNPGIRALYARLLLDSGAKKLAKKEFEEILRLDPEHAEAKAQLRKLKWSF